MTEQDYQDWSWLRHLPSGTFHGYQAATGYEKPLSWELGNDLLGQWGPLFFAKGPLKRAVWAQNVWIEPALIDIASIGDGVKALKGLNRNWWLGPTSCYRRAQLIAAKLPHFNRKPLSFPPEPLPKAPMGSWTLLDQNVMLASHQCREPFPGGEYHFAEDKSGPPNRAYLKLWETFTRIQRWPRPGERCLEIGASPGGWTYVLARLGADVLAVDRAPLEPEIMAMPGVRFEAGDAFARGPEQVGKIDWLFSDVICYPDRLSDYLNRWLQSGLCSQFICTIKFQGQEHYSYVREFQAIPSAQVFHLFHNKHELTFCLLSDSKS